MCAEGVAGGGLLGPVNVVGKASLRAETWPCLSWIAQKEVARWRGEESVPNGGDDG